MSLFLAKWGLRLCISHEISEISGSGAQKRDARQEAWQNHLRGVWEEQKVRTDRGPVSIKGLRH